MQYKIIFFRILTNRSAAKAPNWKKSLYMNLMLKKVIDKSKSESCFNDTETRGSV